MQAETLQILGRGAGRWQHGKPLVSRVAVVDLIAPTTTKTGLTVQCELYEKSYAKGRWCMCGRPLGCKRKDEKSDGRIDCDHVSGLVDAAR
jgi:hypothetical protein